MTESQNEAFQKKLLETFIQESKEHIDTLSNGLVNLKNSDPVTSKELVETLFREAHSFKGASRSVNISEIEEVCKALEDIFSRSKQSPAPIPIPLLETMLEANDLLALLAGSDEATRRDLKPRVQTIIHRLRETSVEEAPGKKSAFITLEENGAVHVNEQEELPSFKEEELKKVRIQTIAKGVKGAETIRVPVEKLNAIMRQSEEMLFAKIASKRYGQELHSIAEEIGELKKSEGISRATLAELTKIESTLFKAIKQANGDAREINIMVDRLMEEMKDALMLPFSTLFYTLPKMVHDLAKSVGKEVILNVIGGEVEIDRRILEQMHDPLLHLLRNAIDHGIERGEERVQKGKNKIGTVTLTLTQKNGSKVELSVRDDGGGIDVEKIATSAVNKGIIDESDEESLKSESVMNLIFQSGISTAEKVNDLSGRGLGLAIVLEKTEQLGGQVDVHNLREGGAEFTILLPLTMATFRGVVTSLNGQKFIFPSDHVIRVLKEEYRNIQNIEGKEILIIDHDVMALYHLNTVLEFPPVNHDLSSVSVVIIQSGNEKIAIAVDTIDYEEEVMVKSLGKQLSRVKNISGAALLSSDIPALVLNISDIFKSVGKVTLPVNLPLREVGKKKPKILAVDDSPTTRALLQHIMEMVGYDVITAVDGLDGYEKLQQTPYDLVVSDVDMPRMNGFELTESIRGNSQFSELPVILVTSLESAEDKERGMHVGANAYIVKSTFDQNNLIETIQWLIE
ncbi:MAG: response regulator [Sulfuricurvum sp.]|nr:response regulator [Sulfuricurvum sp.]